MKTAGETPRRAITLVMFGHVRPTHEGADGSAWELAESLYRAGRLAHVICYGFDASDGAIPADRFVIPGRRVYGLAMLLFEKLAPVFPRGVRRQRERLFDWLVSRSPELRSADVVVFRKPNFSCSARVLRRLGIPTVAIASILHPRMNYDRVGAEAERLGIVDRSPYHDLRRVRQLERFFMDCDRILTTKSIGESSFIAYGIPRSRIVTTALMNGTDCERFRPRDSPRRPGPLRFLHLSTMNLIKGVGILFEVWRDLDLERAELILAGGMDESTQQVFDRVAPPGCVVLGSVSDPASCYRGADVFISPSLSDSAPNTVLEALASGVPVVVSDACGASGLVRNGVNGFVYPWNDAGALAERIAWCHAHPDQLAKLGRAARETALANQRGAFGEAVIRAADTCTSSR